VRTHGRAGHVATDADLVTHVLVSFVEGIDDDGLNAGAVADCATGVVIGRVDRLLLDRHGALSPTRLRFTLVEPTGWEAKLNETFPERDGDVLLGFHHPTLHVRKRRQARLQRVEVDTYRWRAGPRDRR